MKCKCGHDDGLHFCNEGQCAHKDGCPCPAFTPEEPVKLPEGAERPRVAEWWDDYCKIDSVRTPDWSSFRAGYNAGHSDGLVDQTAVHALNADVRQALEAERDRLREQLGQTQEALRWCYHGGLSRTMHPLTRKEAMDKIGRLI